MSVSFPGFVSHSVTLDNCSVHLSVWPSKAVLKIIRGVLFTNLCLKCLFILSKKILLEFDFVLMSDGYHT